MVEIWVLTERVSIMSQPMPPSAIDWNNLFSLTAYIAVTAVAVVVGAMVFFAIRYRQKTGHQKSFNTSAYRAAELEKA